MFKLVLLLIFQRIKKGKITDMALILVFIETFEVTWAFVFIYGSLVLNE